MIDQENQKAPLRIAILCGSSDRHAHTCATLIRNGINVVGICRTAPTVAGLPVKTAIRWIKKGYFLRTCSQILGRCLYSCVRRRKDRRILSRIFDCNTDRKSIQQWAGEIHIAAQSNTYSDPETIKKLTEWKPDILVVHTPAWVGKAIRDIPKAGYVIGGHPGITPFYRGSHSAFWAIYKGKPQDVGWTVFLLDSGVDTGPVIEQGSIDIQPEDSYMTLNAKGMSAIAVSIVSTIKDLQKGKPLAAKPHDHIPDESEYPVPGVWAHWKYWRNRKAIERQRNAPQS